jgi:hypothetical protein
MSRTNKLHPSHPITLCNSICIEVKQKSILMQDISGVLKFAKLFTSTKQNAWNTCGGVSLVFEGYRSDPREIWEISEVRAYVKKLTTAWPTWMFFLDNSRYSLVVCFMCLCEMERTDNPNKQRVVSFSNDVVTLGFEGIAHICSKFKFDEDTCQQISNHVASSLNLRTDSLNSGVATVDQKQGSAA